jgi:HlyD family secretion protein
VSSEYYSITTASLDNDVQIALDNYNSAVEKLEEFDSYVVDNKVLSEYNGVVTEVPLDVSDTISQNTRLLTLYDQDEVTMDISISEDDYNVIDVDGQVNISYTAYPDTVYSGEITEVSDAEYDSSTGEIYYTLTITVGGDVSGLYEGMTGDVTLVTKETREVTYVSNRAIFREGTRSYVKVRNENQEIVEKDVETGFSDGVNVEIVEGLSKGDVVLIESKVSD